VILGTAGHIDHGKTALVRALTGVDTDRLPEEKTRGITIDLGFAPLPLEGVGTLGVVDVPGHEAFVRTMLAGATGVDLALVVVAADEGVMPQTSEHLAILTLLGVRHGVIALSKSDLVEPEWLRLVEDDVRGALAGTTLAGARTVAVSARTGAGLDQLREVIAEVARSALHPAVCDDLFRMPVDRVFTLEGTGTVVTGTVWSGELLRGAAWIHPPGRAVRVRDLQTHGQRVESVRRGMRAAVALADVSVGEVSRGAVLVTSDEWQPTQTLRAGISLLAGSEVRLTGRTAVRLHIGSAEIGARIVRLSPGLARVHLDAPTVCRAGDRYVLRGGPGPTTIGGGTVLDPYARRRARALHVAESTPQAMLGAFCAEAGTSGVGVASLPVRLGIAPTAVAAVIDDPSLTMAGGRVYLSSVGAAARERLIAAVEQTHRDDPLEPGLSLEQARAAARVPGPLFDAVLGSVVRDEQLVVQRTIVHRPGWVPRLDESQSRLARSMMHAFCSSTEPVTESQVVRQFGPAATPVLRQLEREGSVVRLGGSLVVPAATVAGLVDRLRAAMDPGRSYSPAELRDALGVSRRLLIPLLEHCDRVRVTERRGSERFLRE
jgi:selenocysteine-specific elongation factor